jgi:protein translocase SecG subunit
MVNVLTIVQVVLAILLILLILLQRTNTDAGGAFSTEGGSGIVLKKRGGELLLHRATIVTAIAFVLAVAYPLLLSIVR